MKTVSVHASRSYEIRIGRGLLQGAGEQISAVTDAKKVMLVSDDAVWPLYGDAVRHSLEAAGLTVCSFVFPHGESSKCACTYLELLDALCAQQLTRKDAIAVLGGGVAHAGDFLLDAVRAALGDYVYCPALSWARVELARLGNDAGIIGAAMLGRNV